jgi:DNA (cytosine-5)-methyltransferase 1
LKYNYLDLFHGIGGFALGAYWAGMKFDNHFCSDIEPYTVELYKKRFPDSVQLGDITKIDWHKLKKDFPGEWLMSGGFPCQDISSVGKGKGLIDEQGNKTRSGLWFDYRRGISILQPRFAIMENVGALRIRGIETVLYNLSEIGYNAEWQDIRASDMGAPHRRERIWIISYPGHDARGTKQKLECQSKTEKSFNLRSNGVDSRHEMADTSCKLSHGTREKRNRGPKFTNCHKRKGKNFWSIEPDVGRLAHGVPRRVDRLKGLGNAIVPQIAEQLFYLIKELYYDKT